MARRALRSIAGLASIAAAGRKQQQACHHSTACTITTAPTMRGAADGGRPAGDTA